MGYQGDMSKKSNLSLDLLVFIGKGWYEKVASHLKKYYFCLAKCEVLG